MGVDRSSRRKSCACTKQGSPPCSTSYQDLNGHYPKVKRIAASADSQRRIGVPQVRHSIPDALRRERRTDGRLQVRYEAAPLDGNLGTYFQRYPCAHWREEIEIYADVRVGHPLPRVAPCPTGCLLRQP